MRVFFIFAKSEVNDRSMVELISAFAGIESLGEADDMIEAIGIIRARYPEAMIADARIFARKPELLCSLFDKEECLIILPQDHRIRGKSIYVGMDFSSIDPINFGWIIGSIRKVIEECRGRAVE